MAKINKIMIKQKNTLNFTVLFLIWFLSDLSEISGFVSVSINLKQTVDGKVVLKGL